MTRRNQFRRNLEALTSRGIDPEPIRKAWANAQRRFSLYIDANGIDQVLWQPEHDTPKWLPCLADHPALAQKAPKPHDANLLMPGPYLFEGLDLGYLFERIYTQTRDVFLGYSSALYIVEQNAGMFAMLLHLRNWESILADDRVHILVGPEAVSTLDQLWRQIANLHTPTQIFIGSSPHRAAAPQTEHLIRETISRRDHRVRENHATLQKVYKTRNAAFWANRFREALDGSGPPLRILAPVSAHTSFLKYAMRDTKRAAERMGHTFRVITEKSSHDIVSPQTIQEQIQSFQPDLFFSIDHIRPEFGWILPDGLPLMTWDQDALPGVFTREKAAGMSPLDTVVGLPQINCVAQYNRDPRQFLVAQMPTCPDQFDQPDPTTEEFHRYACDVSYVSHASQTPEAFHEAELQQYADPNARKLLNRIHDIVRHAFRHGATLIGAAIQTIVQQAEHDSGVQINDTDARSRVTNWHTWRLCDRYFRHAALEWVADWARRNNRDFRIYGAGWDLHPTLSSFAAGPTENGRPLFCVYRASKINLQLMPAGFLHQRALDGLSAGGFFLTRRVVSDRPDPWLTRLHDTIQRRGFKSAAELLAQGDQTLIRHFRTFQARTAHSTNRDDETFYLIQIDMAYKAAEDIFPDFDAITFDDADTFAQRAEHFLADPDRRSRIAGDMRRRVVQSFSYEATIRRFLEFARDYYRSIA
jgi:hypothetical protein